MLTDAQIQLLISAVDHASRVLQQLEARLGDLEKAVSRFNAASAGAARDATSHWRGFGSALDDLSRIASRAIGAILNLFGNLVSGALNLAKAIGESLVSAFQSLVTIAERAALVIGGTLVAGMVAVGKAGVEMNVAAQGARNGLEVLLGSGAAADRMMGILTRTAVQTSFHLKDLYPITLQLAGAFGPGPGVEGQINRTILAFNALRLATGATEEDARRALRQFAQMVASPTVREEDIRTLQENLPGANTARLLQQRFGTADTETLTKAGVTGRQVAEAFVEGWLAQFGPAAAKMAQSLPVVLSNFGDAFDQLSKQITGPFTATAAKALQSILDVFTKLAENKSLVSALAVPFDLLGVALTKLAGAAPAFADWLTQILTKQNVIEFLARIAGFFVTLKDNVLDFINAATAGGGIASVWEGFQKAAETAIDFVLRLWKGLVAGITYFAKNSDDVWAAIKEGIDAVRSAVEMLVGVIVVGLGVKAFAAISSVLGLLGIGGGIGGAIGALPAVAAAAALPATHPGTSPFEESDAWKGIRDWKREHMPWMPEFGPGAGGPAFGTGPGGRSNYIPSEGGGGGGMSALGAGADFASGVGEFLRSTGAGALGWGAAAGGGVLADLKRRFPAIARVAEGTIGAISGGMGAPGSGIGGFNQDWARNTANIAGGINAFLGPGAAAGTGGVSGMPPRLGEGGGGGTTGGGGAMLDPKQVKELMDAQKAMWAAQLEAAKAFITNLPESQRAAAEVGRIVPMLRDKMEDLADQAQYVAPESKEYYDLVKEYWSTQADISEIIERLNKEIRETRLAATAAQLAAAKAQIAGLPQWQRSVQEALVMSEALADEQNELEAVLAGMIPHTKEYYDTQAKIWDLEAQKLQIMERGVQDNLKRGRDMLNAQTALQKAQLQNNPFLSAIQREQALMPALLTQFGFLSQPVKGESPIEAIHRQIEAEGIRGEIMKASGVFGPGGRPQFAAMLGGGMMPLFNMRQYANINQTLSAIQQQSAGMVRGEGWMEDLLGAGGPAGWNERRGSSTLGGIRVTNIIIPAQIGSDAASIAAMVREQLENLERQATGSAASGN